MNYIIHRGIHKTKEEENKIKGFMEALDNPSYLGIETDIRVTKDNEFVLYHDFLYKGALVKETEYRKMKQDNIPRLKDLLKINTNKILLLEIKDFNIDINKLIKLLDKYERNIYIMSFNNKVIEKIAKVTNKYKLGILNYVFNTINDYKYDFIGIINSFLTKDLINKFKAKNITIFSYGVSSKKDMRYNVTYIVDNKVFN